MTFEEYWGEGPDPGKITAKHAWNAGQAAERERIKGRVKEAAKSIWAVRDLVDNRYGLYIGPPLNTMEQFVEKLMIDDGHSFVGPLYRHPRPKSRLTDEEINDCFDIAQRSFHKHQSGIKGQQLNIQDWPNWHFARAIEQKIWEKAE